ncbi:DUF1559 family PulG-like putative transporter [Gimesia panareensis]|uniref:DUF1559 family PulG-like putative transporter n=1 Tax=Gimesia panareensis TaxID=2527978 RepID=UPI00118B6D0C|nr:DUF1559 domain-containing protein [Gimesia panareensis]QDU47806.1 hypothetical protein Pan110_01160 [Gimesia panareensis]
MENEAVATTRKPRRWQGELVGFTLPAIIVLMCAGVMFPIQAVFYLAVGWFLFLKRVLPAVTVSLSGIITAVVFLALLALFIQLLGTHLFRLLRNQEQIPASRYWQKRWTGVCLLLLVVAFTGGFAVVGVAHQSAWMVTGKQAAIETTRGQSAWILSSRYSLRRIGLGVVNYSTGADHHIPSGIFRNGQPLHSWETEILPFLDQSEYRQKIDETQPWNSKRNSELFKHAFTAFIPPGAEQYNRQGYGLSYYSLNNHVFSPGSDARLDDIPDGLSNTLMGGEVSSRVRAWGDPINFRDPARGISQHDDGFGGPWRSGGANMLFLDGSARFINKDIDPAILKALATPDGGEDVSDFQGGR